MKLLSKDLVLFIGVFLLFWLLSLLKSQELWLS